MSEAKPWYDVGSVLALGTLIFAAAAVVVRRAGSPELQLACYAGALALSALYVGARRGLVPALSWEELGFKRPSWDSLVFGLLCGGLALGLSVALLKTGYYPPQKFVIGGAAAGGGAFAPLFLATVCQVTGEELLFRGYLLTRLRAAWGAEAALAVSSLAFMAVHAPLFLGPLGFGVLFGAAFLRTRNIAAPVLAHLVLNGTIVTSSFLQAAR